MSKLGPEHRSYLPISHGDLVRLAAIAAADRAAYFARYPDWAELYAGRVLCTALCQGAALHYLHSEAGIQDFDLSTFYAEHPARIKCRPPHSPSGVPARLEKCRLLCVASPGLSGGWTWLSGLRQAAPAQSMYDEWAIAALRFVLPALRMLRSREGED